ncbi:monovalent cation/H+ antiporter subunit D [Allopusillimonas soli]|uniref:Monovalent cation/H+ antiporter subunit D n=1 Tax=Allopusillimonas soli TaxID=659016 RepID=A0A853F4L2_9BURK|nr:monovalent cation/H+ antiporter subunit D [Allopusillimonas soli]NYT35415.1 monovalent cation/H+ antiporter subunit D [Allopusillimonas soli]TEA75830.1 monovalent cation/H+ antiporter subunit D [Allopusillimonas soli]
MTAWLQHLSILPVAVPLAAGAAMLLTGDSRRRWRLALGLLSIVIQLALALTLLSMTTGYITMPWPDGVGVYLLGDWPAPFGIVAVVDRLSVVMLLLTAVLGAAAWTYATARWDRSGVHFHPLFQFLLMGLNGAFLTGDLFNLFVFFEVLLAASYGLMLHGSGRARVAAGLHYVVINLVSSFLLLIAMAIIYGVTGTLNMADLAVQAGLLSGHERQLFETGAAILGVAFLIKAAAWPLNFWLPAAYASACPPVGGMFAIMTKVGIYALLRIGSLLLPTGAPAAFGGAWMFPVGMATLAFGTIGILATTQVERQAGYCIIMSSGTLLAALGMPGVTLTGPALFYLIVSVLTLGAFFMLLELIERTQPFGAELLAVSLEAFDVEDEESPERSDDVVGVAIPAAMAFLGLAFIACGLLVTGLPPLSGFVAKFALLSAALGTSALDLPSVASWSLIAGILISGMSGIIAFSRTGIRLFWSNEDMIVPRLRISEAGPIGALVLACVLLTFWAGPVMSYLDNTARYLDKPDAYINAVLSQSPVRSVGGGQP